MKLAASLLLSVNAQWWNQIGNAIGLGPGTTTISTTTTSTTTTTTATTTTTITPTTTTTTKVIDNTPTVPSDAPITVSTPNNSGTSGMPSDVPVTVTTKDNSGTSTVTSDVPASTGKSTSKVTSTTVDLTTNDLTTVDPTTVDLTTVDQPTDSWTDNWNGTDSWTGTPSWTDNWDDITTISISFPEFTTARPISIMTTCEKMRDDVLNSNIVGAWVPECSLQGEFTTRQCNYSARTCWCVGENGNELDGTRQFFADPTLIEDKKCPTQVEFMTPCERMREEVESSMMTGAWLPSCNDAGDFESLQCNMSARTCWCVDSKGDALDDTHEFFEDPSGMYDKKCSAPSFGPCFSLRERIDREGHVQGEYWPQCKDDGLFYPKQCVFKTRSCWCVEKDGERTSDAVFFDSLTRLKEYECKAPISKPDINHNQEGLHFHGVNIMDLFTNILGQHLPEGLLPDGHKPENYEDVMESILGKTSLGNLNYAPVNTNVQNFVNINTEIDTDIDININGQNFGLSGLMEMFSEKMKSDADMSEIKEKIVDCIKNFHLESYAYKLLPILKATAAQNGIKEDEFNKIVHEILSKFQ